MKGITYEGTRLDPPTLPQWKRLFDAADQLRELQPWKDFSDLDTIRVVSKDGSDAVCTILGQSDIQYGISMYPGARGMSDCMLLASYDDMNLSPELAQTLIRSLNLYWDMPHHITEPEKAAIRELGLAYGDQDLWPHVVSLEPGYFPWLPSAKEADELASYLEMLAPAVVYFREHDLSLDSEAGDIYVYGPDASDPARLWRGTIQNNGLPSVAVEYLIIEGARSALVQTAPSTNAVLQMNMVVLGGMIRDPKYVKPCVPLMIIICDQDTGRIVDCKVFGPDEHPAGIAVQMLSKFISDVGNPAQVQVSNPIMEAALMELAEKGGFHIAVCDVLDQLDMATEALKASVQGGGSSFYFGLHGIKS